MKKAQKNEKKKQTSLTINNIIPIRKLRCTAKVCFPNIVASYTTSRHHWNKHKIISTAPINNRYKLL